LVQLGWPARRIYHIQVRRKGKRKRGWFQSLCHDVEDVHWLDRGRLLGIFLMVVSFVGPLAFSSSNRFSVASILDLYTIRYHISSPSLL